MGQPRYRWCRRHSKSDRLYRRMTSTAMESKDGGLRMNIRVTMASCPADSMHRGSWSRVDDGTDLHDTADWIKSRRRANGLRPRPRSGQVWAQTLSKDLSGQAGSS